MRRESGDTIQFESRVELGRLLKALGTYMNEHKEDEISEVRRLYDLLDVMEMEWQQNLQDLLHQQNNK